MMIDHELFAFDTNVIIYAEGADDDAKQRHAKTMTRALGPRLVIPTQVLGETYNVLVRRHGFSRKDARLAVGQWQKSARLHAATEETFTAALDLAATHNLQFWDALVLATAADARCRLLLTEDLHDGFVYRGCTVANPFLPMLHPLLRDALERG